MLLSFSTLRLSPEFARASPLASSANGPVRVPRASSPQSTLEPHAGRVYHAGRREREEA